MKTFLKSEAGAATFAGAMVAVLVSIAISSAIVLSAPIINEWSIQNSRKRAALGILESKMNEITWVFENEHINHIRGEEYDVVIDDRGNEMQSDDIVGKLRVEVKDDVFYSNQGQGISPQYWYKEVDIFLSWNAKVGFGIKAGRKHTLMLRNRYYYGSE